MNSIQTVYTLGAGRYCLLFSGRDSTIAAKCNGMQRIMRTTKRLRNIEEQ
jgi:hypothetical protein